MYKICQTEQSTRRQRELEKGLLQLMLRRKYEDISVSDLCDQMQIPRKSFYRYFSSKDGILFALIDHTIDDFFQAPVENPQNKHPGIIDLDRFFQFWYENQALLDALQRSNLSGILVERVNRFAVTEGHFPQQFQHLRPLEREAAMAFTTCGLMAMLLSWHGQGFPLSPKEMTDLTVKMMTKPMLTK